MNWFSTSSGAPQEAHVIFFCMASSLSQISILPLVSDDPQHPIIFHLTIVAYSALGAIATYLKYLPAKNLLLKGESLRVNRIADVGIYQPESVVFLGLWLICDHTMPIV
jgi:hypothetical protein